MEDCIVLYPSPGRGHLISMVELGKVILKLHPSFSITILILSKPKTNIGSTAPQYVSSSTTQYMATVNSTAPSINFHHLPPFSKVAHSTCSPVELNYLIPRLNNPNLHQTLETISQTSKLKAFIIDFFCDAAFEVASNLTIPTYYFFTSSPSCLALFLYRPTLHKNKNQGFKDLNNMILDDIPGLPPIWVSDLPKDMFDRTSKVYKYFLNTAAHMAKSNGLVLNTFDLLEIKATKAISGGLCVPDGPTPPILCIGPLISNTNQDGEVHECLNWLNSQPKKQVKEIAVGLENSGQRFLWVVRNPPPDKDKDPNLDELLPKGFLERTKDKGFVSVGGFVTHCGWNSMLEAVWYGVPMVGWPLYAEQRLNRTVLVEETKLALGLNDSADGFVSATELEKRVRELMYSEVGIKVRERVSNLRDKAVVAVGENGPLGMDAEEYS
ncbi:hypothetical protein ACJW30_12G049900 [Castanea mollissima]